MHNQKYEQCKSCHAEECGNCKIDGDTTTNFLSEEVKERCRDCGNISEGYYEEWYCDVAQDSCKNVKDCPEEQYCIE